ncbi:hypothetical protein BC629DRAFT_915240 [Irpex lacteus]|nr:hypothetical protein BC629DRAFT_915240 [Irpex lacteus]
MDVIQSAQYTQRRAWRSGTRIFMAIKLVENLANEIEVCHVYDFDVESLAYVALWVTSRYNGSCVINSPPCSDWITATPQMLASSGEVSFIPRETYYLHTRRSYVCTGPFSCWSAIT